MTKQIFNSFKELQGMLSESKVEIKDVNNPDKEPSKLNVANKAGYIPKKSFKTVDKKFKKQPKRFSLNLVKSIDPKLQPIFDALNWLKATFPKTFMNPPAKVVPLKVGIGQDIVDFIKAEENPQFSLTVVRKALSMYTNNFRYLIATSKCNAPRIDLAGNVMGEVNAEQAQYAQSKLAALKERNKNKIAQNPSSIQDLDVNNQQNN